MWTWIISIALKIISSPLVRQIALSFFQDLLETGQTELPIVMAAVKEAWDLPEGTSGSDRFDYVVKKVKERLPGIQDALLNRLIEACYGALKKGPVPA